MVFTKVCKGKENTGRINTKHEKWIIATSLLLGFLT